MRGVCNGQVHATQLAEKAANMKKAVNLSKQETQHLFAKVPGEESLASRIHNWADKIQKLEVSTVGLLCVCVCVIIHLGNGMCHDFQRTGREEIRDV